MTSRQKIGFSERALLFLLAGVQFCHILDFMIMMPLGPQLMRELSVTPEQFSWLVSAYTLSAGVIGLCAAPFMDRFDRRWLLLLTFAGFGIGTLACGLAKSYGFFLSARALCGAFGGISGSVVLTIVGDVIPAERRASGMAIIMTAFAVASALGVPFGLFLAHEFVWETPFLTVAGVAFCLWVLIWFGMPPVRGHLEPGVHAARTFWDLLRDRNAGRALLFMSALVGGHFALIPLMPAYLVANVGLPEKSLFLVYLIGGILTIFTSPAVGRSADRLGRRRVYAFMVIMACLVTLAISHAGPMPVWAILALTGSFFVFASGRFGPAQAIMSMAVPPQQRGSFMSLNSFARDLTSGITAALGGWIVSKTPSGQLVHFNWLGWLAVAASLGSLWLVRGVSTDGDKRLSGPN